MQPAYLCTLWPLHSPNGRRATGSESVPAGLSSGEDEDEDEEEEALKTVQSAPPSATILKKKKKNAHSRRSPPLSCMTRRSCRTNCSSAGVGGRRSTPLDADTVSQRVFQLPRPARRHDCLIGSSYFRGNYYHSDYVNHCGSLLLRVAPNSSSSPICRRFISPPRV